MFTEKRTNLSLHWLSKQGNFFTWTKQWNMRNAYVCRWCQLRQAHHGSKSIKSQGAFFYSKLQDTNGPVCCFLVVERDLFPGEVRFFWYNLCERTGVCINICSFPKFEGLQDVFPYPNGTCFRFQPYFIERNGWFIKIPKGSWLTFSWEWCHGT